MKIYCFDMPTFNAYKVLLVAEELGLEYALVKLAAMAGEHKEAAHLKRHPLGKIPVLEHDGRTIIESMAITRYLRDIAEVNIDGDDVHQSDQFSEFMIQHCGRAIANIYWQEIVLAKSGRSADSEVVASAAKQLARELPLLEDQLQSNDWFGGGQYSFADCVILSYCLALDGSSQTLEAWPALDAWKARALDRDATKKALDHYRPQHKG